MAASKPAATYTSLTFQCRHLFFHCQPCEVRTGNSAAISFRFGEIDSLTSLTLGEGRERKPPGSGKVKAALGGHGLGLPESCEKLVSCLIYLFCWFLISKRANAFLLHVHDTQQSSKLIMIYRKVGRECVKGWGVIASGCPSLHS